MYPLLSEYIEAILSADDNLEQLRGLKPVLDSTGRPMMSSGNYAVVFKMQDSAGHYYALKCFLREQEERHNRYRSIAKRLNEVYSPYFVNVYYYDHELFVDTANSEQREFPVLIMDWVEGLTLNEYIRQNLDSELLIKHLAYSFGEMASWLIKQDFAHGDIKPDNIIVQKDGSIVLVDYDGMFVPDLKNKSAAELGSPNYRHPLRKITNFDSRIDDFSLIVILLSLKIMSNCPELWNSTPNPDGLLFCESDFKDIMGSEVLKRAHSTFDEEIHRLLGLLLIAISNKALEGIDGTLLKLKNPTLVKIFKYSRSHSDKNKLVYSKDHKCLLSGHGNTDSAVQVMAGTQFIAFDAFQNNKSIRRIELPEGLLGIGRNAFSGCLNLEEITIPDTLLYYEDLWGLKGCHSIKSIRSNYFHTENNSLIIHGHLVRVLSADPLKEYSIPKSVIHVEDEAFSLCAPICVLHYPKSLEVNPEQFAYSSIKAIDHADASEDHHCIIKNNELICFVADEPIDYRVPDNVTIIGDHAFGGAKHLKTVLVPSSVRQLGWGCFADCYLLSKVTLPNSLEYINFFSFESCSSLERIYIPDSVKSIYQSAFANCKSLEEVELGTQLQTIGGYAFENCSKLKSIKFKSSSVSIDFSAFIRCTSLKEIMVPMGKAEAFRKMEAFTFIHNPVNIVEYEV